MRVIIVCKSLFDGSYQTVSAELPDHLVVVNPGTPQNRIMFKSDVKDGQ